jgi:hypothetical protein
MRRNQALALVFVVAAAFTGCATTDNTNNRSNSNANGVQREGVVDTNANIPANANSRSVPSNTGVLTNDNGNANTDGVKSINSNKANSNRHKN